MRRLTFLFPFLFLALVLTLPAWAGESAAPAVAEKEAVAAEASVARLLEGADQLGYDDLWDRVAQLAALGPDAGDALTRALVPAAPREKLAIAKVLIGYKTYAEEAGKVLLELAAKAPAADVRIYAANSLGQSTLLVGNKGLTEGLGKAAEAEKEPLVLVALQRARGRLGEDAAAADALLAVMKNGSGRVRKEAALALGEIGRAGTPEVRREILSIFRNDPTEMADRALSIYRNNQSRDPLFTEILFLIDEFSDADKDRRDRDKLVRAAVQGMVASLDPFSEYLEPEDAKQLTEHLAGEYGGIGAYVNQVDGVFTIVSPIYDGPAHKAGLRSMDRILEVDGLKTSGEPINKTIARLKGQPGTAVKVKIFRRGWREPQEMSITRDKISVQSVMSEMLPGDIGYLRLRTFGPRTPEELDKALKDLGAAGMKGLVLDLRDNPGGYLEAAVEVSGKFLAAEQVVVSSKGRRWRTRTYKATEDGPAREVPMTVLVNSGSASASEIVAGALRDNKRATLVGRKTFGKGSVQQPIDLKSEAGAKLKLTIAKYYLPSGECIHEKGIAPDVDAPAEEDITPGWRYEELYKISAKLEEFAVALYKQDPAAAGKLADDDGGDGARYPGLAEKLKDLGSHLAPEDVRSFVHREVRRLVADERGKRFMADLEDDRQLRKAALVLLDRMKVAVKDLPAPYARYVGKFAAEDKEREALAADRALLPKNNQPENKKDEAR